MSFMFHKCTSLKSILDISNIDTCNVTHMNSLFSGCQSLYELPEYFVERYYNDKKQIRGKDIYNLFDINDISPKLGEIVGDTLLYNDYNEEEDNLDAMGEL